MVGKRGGIRLKVDGVWLQLSSDFLTRHPGGGVVNQYSNADATHVFHAFHEGSSKAYKQLRLIKKEHQIEYPGLDPTLVETINERDVNVSSYDVSLEKEVNIVRNFEKLRQEMHNLGLLEPNGEYYLSKTLETLSFVLLAFILQYLGWYLTSACFLALGWQQLGWLTHEYCHHSPLKSRRANDLMSLVLGNVAQGFSRDWWKNKHNIHHAATNIIDQDGDIDMAPLMALVPDDLRKYKQPFEAFFLKLIPYQHLYFTFMLPMLRFSWTAQSIQFVIVANSSKYRTHRKNALAEQIGIIIHWTWVIFQLWLLPSFLVRVLYFIISQMGAGFLIAHVVTYNHNSVDKFPANSRLLNNFACLHILTTRNMRPSPFIDWLWGGLNYQIEHHLFPTMPRPNLNRASQLVKKFCADNDLPYLADDFWTGYKLNLKQLENVAVLAKSKLDS